jgi:hypothetical protein
MCGIGGFSLAKGSKINPRKLSNALLTALEDRGYMASGVAWQSLDGSRGYHKAAVPGSGLALKGMPKNANVGIVHTRLATHGSTTDNRNNHPVLSPDESIALVHNGVIYNHNYVRSILSSRIKFEVDTAVIPALIQENNYDLEALRHLDGDAAIAWLRDDDPGVLHLARLEHSPMTICQLDDGSFVFASTEALLWRVLIQLDLMPDIMTGISEYTYLKVTDGVIQDMTTLGRSTAVSSSYDYGYYRHQTSGAKGSNPYASDANPFGYGAYDDDYWDMKDWNDSYQTGLTCSTSSKDKYDFLGTALKGEPAYYIAYRNKFTESATQYAYYSDLKYEDYEDDLSMFDQWANDYILMDYGTIDANGLLMSDKPVDEVVVDSTLF